MEQADGGANSSSDDRGRQQRHQEELPGKELVDVPALLICGRVNDREQKETPKQKGGSAAENGISCCGGYAGGSRWGHTIKMGQKREKTNSTKWMELVEKRT